MSRSKVCVFAACCLFLILLPVSVRADMGPKPSVTVCFEGLQGEQYYATLLSDRDTMGPWSASGQPESLNNQAEQKAEEGFQNFQALQESGFYYLHFIDDCTKDQELDWGYYPPQVFQILLYFPQYDSYAVSGTYERYAFHSEYKVFFDAKQAAALREGNALLSGFQAERAGGPWEELLGASSRFLLTLVLELGLALLFGFRQKRQLRFLFWVNFATQLALNAVLFLFAYQWGGGFFEMACYLGMELLIFVLEAVLYAEFLPRLGCQEREKHPKAAWTVFYAFLANAGSFGVGILLSKLWPQLF